MRMKFTSVLHYASRVRLWWNLENLALLSNNNLFEPRTLHKPGEELNSLKWVSSSTMRPTTFSPQYKAETYRKANIIPIILCQIKEKTANMQRLQTQHEIASFFIRTNSHRLDKCFYFRSILHTAILCALWAHLQEKLRVVFCSVKSFLFIYFSSSIALFRRNRLECCQRYRGAEIRSDSEKTAQIIS